MSLFTDADLAGFANLAEDLALKDTCEILREYRAVDPFCGRISWWTVVQVVPAMVVAGSVPTRGQVAQQVVGKLPQTIWLPPRARVLRTDWLAVAGQVYEITDLTDPTTYTVLRSATVQRRETGDYR